MSEQQSCKRVCGDEFPGICGSQCNPTVCGGSGPTPTPPAPTPTPPTGGRCSDSPSGWHDSDGPKYNCAWYSIGNRCQRYGDGYANRGKTANQACCVCGGGVKIGKSESPSTHSTMRPSLSPSIHTTESPSSSSSGISTMSPSSTPTMVAACEDSPIGWYDSDGPDYDCNYYAQGDNCAMYGN